MTELAVLLTCHNRREQTLACLRSLFDALEGVLDFEVFLTDDGSTDGTADAVHASYPSVHIIEGDGTLFWCRGMHRAWEAALPVGFDAYLWVNDDVVFTTHDLRRFIDGTGAYAYGSAGDAIVVGSVADPDSGVLTYGGSVLTSRWHPGRMERVEPSDEFQTIDTFNGNAVFVPRSVVQRIGIIDPVFSHATGDIDYGLRAKAAGVSVILAPAVVGTCSRNPPIAHTLRSMLGRKGLPWRDWLVYTRRHGDWRWPIAFFTPYVRSALAGLSTLGGRTSEHGQKQ